MLLAHRGAGAGSLSRPLRFALAAALGLVSLAVPAVGAPFDRAAALRRARERAPEQAALATARDEGHRLLAAAGAAPHAPRLEFEAAGDGVGPFGAGSREVRVGLSQELDVHGVRDARRARARAELGVLDAGDAARLLAVGVRTEQAFGALLVAGRRLALAESVAAASGRIVLAARRAARAEALSPYALRQLELDDAATRAVVAAVRGERDAADVALRGLLGADAGEALQPVDDLAAETPGADPDTLVALALRHRPDVIAARADEALGAAETRLAGREARPAPELGVFVARDRTRVDAEAFGGPLADDPAFAGFTDTGTTIGAALSWPLPFARPGRADEARGALVAARAAATRVRAEVDARAEVRAAVATLAAAEEQVTILAGALAATAGDRARLDDAYRAGRIDLDAYLAQRARLVEAARAALDALAARDAARVARAHATGCTTPELAAALSGDRGGDAR